MYAIIKTGGKQYKAEPGRFIDVEKLDAEVGAEVSFEALMVVDGDDVKVGSPVVDGVRSLVKFWRRTRRKRSLSISIKPKKITTARRAIVSRIQEWKSHPLANAGFLENVFKQEVR